MRRWMTILAVLSGTAAPAQEVQNGQQFGVWNVACTAVAVGQTACTLSQRILRSEDRAFVAQLLAFQSPDQSKTYLSARVPTGVYLPAGFAIQAEGSDEALPFIWQTCGRDLCEAVTEVAPEALATLAADGTVVLGAFRPNLQSENFVFRLSLEGAVEGLAALAAASE